MARSGGYLEATRHPWSCVVFILPLLVIYETGLHLLGSGRDFRNGADAWLRQGLAHLGFHGLLWAPTLLAGVLLLWSWLRRHDRPADFLGVWVGMTVESLVFGLGLWALSRGLWPLLERIGVKLSLAQMAVGTSWTLPDPALEQIISFIGAGIYEEILFRLLLFSTLVWALRRLDFPWLLGSGLAALCSSLVFAAAHNLGSHGEPFDGHVFLFRTLAGLYFTLIYQVRGLGIAVGTHTGYDVLVGLLAQVGRAGG